MISILPILGTGITQVYYLDLFTYLPNLKLRSRDLRSNFDLDCLVSKHTYAIADASGREKHNGTRIFIQLYPFKIHRRNKNTLSLVNELLFFSTVTIERSELEQKFERYRVFLVDTHRNRFVCSDIEKSRSKFDLRSLDFQASQVKLGKSVNHSMRFDEINTMRPGARLCVHSVRSHWQNTTVTSSDLQLPWHRSQKRNLTQVTCIGLACQDPGMISVIYGEMWPCRQMTSEIPAGAAYLATQRKINIFNETHVFFTNVSEHLICDIKIKCHMAKKIFLKRQRNSKY